MLMSFNIESDHMEECQWEMLGETSISSFLDSRWLLYTQSVMSEGKNSSYGDKGDLGLDAVKKESRLLKWAAIKDAVLKAYLTAEFY